MDRQFKVISKGLVGKNETPQVGLKSEEGDKLTLNLEHKKQLDDYEIEQWITVKILKEQQTL